MISPPHAGANFHPDQPCQYFSPFPVIFDHLCGSVIIFVSSWGHCGKCYYRHHPVKVILSKEGLSHICSPSVHLTYLSQQVSLFVLFTLRKYSPGNFSSNWTFIHSCSVNALSWSGLRWVWTSCTECEVRTQQWGGWWGFLNRGSIAVCQKTSSCTWS